MEYERYELVYNIDKNEEYLRLLGEEFYQKNKTFGNFFYKNRKYRLVEKIKTNNLKQDELKIDIIFYKIIYNKRCMFKDCESLIKFSQPKIKDKQYYSQIISIHEEEDNLFDFYDEDKITENTLYENIKDIENFSDYSAISQKNIKESNNSTILKMYERLKFVPKDNSVILAEMFSFCPSLQSIEDISEWNTDNLIDMSGMFEGCSSLEILPDISKWNTYNTTNTSSLFSSCSSLI